MRLPKNRLRKKRDRRSGFLWMRSGARDGGYLGCPKKRLLK
jgi:hypothetical protein